MPKKTISRTHKIISGIMLGVSILTFAFFGRIAVENLSAKLNFDIRGIVKGFGLDIQTDNLGLTIGDGTGDRPGCTGSNCLGVPSANEYQGIATQTSFRDALITWTNFFLGFLSIIAMLSMIYAGFLYITAAGNDEQAQKAKKIIIWVVTGIIVILIAYALVNTLIDKGPTGSDI